MSTPSSISRHISIIFLAALSCGAGEETLPADNPEGVAQAFTERRTHALRSMAGKPMEKPYVSPNRFYVRPQSYVFLNFAFRCLLLDEQNEEANRAVLSFCDLYRDDLEFMRKGDSYYWAGDLLFAIMEKFGTKGSVAPGRLLPATEERILRMLWVYASAESRLADAEVERSATWDVWGSENHHIQKFYMLWHSSKFLMDAPDYRNRSYDDGHPAADHFKAWTRYTKHWLSQRGRKGLFVEFACESYNAVTLKGVYNFHDFTADPRLRELAGHLLDLFWASWAQEQLDGIRGGAKARVYQGAESLTGGREANAPLRAMRSFYTGLGEPGTIDGNLMTLLSNSYVPDPVVLDLMMDEQGRGVYEVNQSCLGLAKDGRNGPPNYRLEQANPGLVRYSYCTPDFVLGSFHCEALQERKWTMISSQNRWMGAIFKGHPDARVVVQCDAGDQRATYNALWGAQSKGTLIAQKLPPGMSKYAGAMRVWVADGGLQETRESGGVVFATYPGAYVAIRVCEGGHAWEKVSGKDFSGRWLVLENDLSPVIIEVARKKSYPSADEFQKRILSLQPVREGAALRYRSLSKDEFVFHPDHSELCEINGSPPDLRPAKVMESPFVFSDADSGNVVIRKGKRSLKLDFTLRPGE